MWDRVETWDVYQEYIKGPQTKFLVQLNVKTFIYNAASLF